jgi:5-methylcytosine-specific restriction endonuclease McrA
LDSTLLLNSSYEPLRVISWQKAITLFFLGKVEVVENYDRSVRSVYLAIKVPAVVRLLKFVKLHSRKPPLTKINLLTRDSFACQYCQKNLSTEESTIDHVVPRSKGGKTTWENVVIACPQCNRKKGGRTPKEAKMALQTSPNAPNWLPVINIHLKTNVPKKWKIFL